MNPQVERAKQMKKQTSLRQIFRRGERHSNKDEQFLATIILDHRASDLQQRLNIRRSDVIYKFCSVFLQHGGGLRTLPLCTVFREFVGEEVTPFAKVLFELFVEDAGCIEFCDLFYAISSFCLFELEEMVKLIWYREDPEKIGHLFESDVVNFMKLLHGEDFNRRNVKAAMKALRFKRDETTTFHECYTWCKAYPCLLEPIFRIQLKFRERFLGIQFWEQAVISLIRERKSLSERELKEIDRQDEERRLLKERRRRIQGEMGLFNYWFDKRRREYMESVYPKPKVYLSDNLEIVVEQVEE